MPIRLCLLITELRLSGAERLVYELATRLDRRAFDVHVAALRGGQVADMLAAAGVDVTVLGVQSKADVLKLPRLVRTLRGTDILHTHLFHADLAGRLAAQPAGVAHLVHTVHVAEQRWRPWQFAFARWTDVWCDRLIAVSQSVADHHSRRSHLPLWRYDVIPNAVDVRAFERDEPKRVATRQAWGLAGDRLAVLFAGRLDRQKGIDTLLESIRLLGRSQVKATFIIAGDGPLRGEVEAFAREHRELCRYVGFVQDMQAALSGADMFVLPSRWEGFGLALGEAMAAGLPCIATDAPGNFFRQAMADGKAGVLVKVGQAAALVDAVAALAADAPRRDELAAGGKTFIAAHHSIQSWVAAHERLYLRLMEEE